VAVLGLVTLACAGSDGKAEGADAPEPGAAEVDASPAEPSDIPEPGAVDVDARRGADEGSSSCESSPGPFEVVLGRPTDSSITISVWGETGPEATAPLAAGTEVAVDYGIGCGELTHTSAPLTDTGHVPVLVELGELEPDTRYGYRLRVRPPGRSDFEAGPTSSFHTQRARGRAFSFGVQGDSHPERAGKMFDASLYRSNLANVAARRPDFYIMLGDDFSIEHLIAKDQLSQPAVDAVYQRQRAFLAGMTHSTALFLVNGNHEQAARYLLTEAYPTPYADAPIFAGLARVTWFPLPAPNDFYTGDEEEIPGIGLLRDYYAWTWGDALFVTLDPYWHSPVPVDTGVPGVDKEKDDWAKTIGDEQYHWLRSTLEASDARWKFVFEHSLLGHGRGGAASVHTFEHGGYDKKGKRYELESRRAGWGKPIHQAMRDAGVTVFFFAHDHVFAREGVDGVVYQSVPNPADDTYTAWNADAYDPDTIALPDADYDPDYGVVLPCSGYLDVTVEPERVTVAYVRAVLPGDELQAGAANGEASFSYEIEAR